MQRRHQLFAGRRAGLGTLLIIAAFSSVRPAHASRAYNFRNAVGSDGHLLIGHGHVPTRPAGVGRMCEFEQFGYGPLAVWIPQGLLSDTFLS